MSFLGFRMLCFRRVSLCYNPKMWRLQWCILFNDGSMRFLQRYAENSITSSLHRDSPLDSVRESGGIYLRCLFLNFISLPPRFISSLDRLICFGRSFWLLWLGLSALSFDCFDSWALPPREVGRLSFSRSSLLSVFFENPQKRSVDFLVSVRSSFLCPFLFWFGAYSRVHTCKPSLCLFLLLRLAADMELDVFIPSGNRLRIQYPGASDSLKMGGRWSGTGRLLILPYRRRRPGPLVDPVP